MRKFLIQIILYFFIISFSFVIINYIANKYLEKKQFHSGFYYTSEDLTKLSKSDTIDVLVLGSSHAYRHYDWRVFHQQGIEIFNLGSSSQTPKQTYFLLQDFLAKKHPKQVIYDLFPNQFYYDGQESDLDLLTNYNNEKSRFKLLLHNFTLIKFKVYSYINFERILSPKHIKKVTKTDTYIKNGFIEKRELTYFSPYEERRKQKNKSDHSPYQFKTSQWNYFIKTVELLKKEKIPYTIIESPYTQYYADTKKPTAEFDSLIIENAIPYISNQNYNNQYNDSLEFYDPHHLNRNGAKKFSQLIIDNYLQK